MINDETEVETPMAETSEVAVPKTKKIKASSKPKMRRSKWSGINKYTCSSCGYETTHEGKAGSHIC